MSSFPRRLRTSIQYTKQAAKNSLIALWTSSTSGPLLALFTRWLAQKQQAYFSASPMWVVLCVGRSSTSLRMAYSSNRQIFLLNLPFITLRHESMISLWWVGGLIENLGSVHRSGSMMKSGKDLWKMWAGSSMLSGMSRRE